MVPPAFGRAAFAVVFAVLATPAALVAAWKAFLTEFGVAAVVVLVLPVESVSWRTPAAVVEPVLTLMTPADTWMLLPIWTTPFEDVVASPTLVPGNV
jgi:hypothetical protein